MSKSPKCDYISAFYSLLVIKEFNVTMKMPCTKEHPPSLNTPPVSFIPQCCAHSQFISTKKTWPLHHLSQLIFIIPFSKQQIHQLKINTDQLTQHMLYNIIRTSNRLKREREKSTRTKYTSHHHPTNLSVDAPLYIHKRRLFFFTHPHHLQKALLQLSLSLLQLHHEVP